MSRTIRRKNETQEYYWILKDWDMYLAMPSGTYLCKSIYLDKNTKAAKKALKHYHGDAGTHKCKEPGPSWYRRITRQVPLRRNSKEELRKFMLDEEHEVMITENPHLEYWT